MMKENVWLKSPKNILRPTTLLVDDCIGLAREDDVDTYIVAPDGVIFASEFFRSSLLLDDTFVEHQGELLLESLACVVTGGRQPE